MSILKLFPAHIRWCKPDGTLTPEAVRILEVLAERVGGMLGDHGVDVFASPETLADDRFAVTATPAADKVAGELVIQSQPADNAAADIVLTPGQPESQPPDIIQQPLEYSAGLGIKVENYSISLKDSAVGPGSYGDAAHVAKFTVDQQGRLTFAESVEIQIPAANVTGLGSMAQQNVGTNFSGSFTGKTVTVANGIITSVV